MYPVKVGSAVNDSSSSHSHFPSSLHLACEHRKTQDALNLSVWETKEETYIKEGRSDFGHSFFESNISKNKYIAEGKQDDLKGCMVTVINYIEANAEKCIPFSILFQYLITLRRKSQFAASITLTLTPPTLPNFSL